MPRGRAPCFGPSQAQERAHGSTRGAWPRFLQIAATSVQRGRTVADERRLSWEELHFRLIERFAPPSVIIDADNKIAHRSENARALSAFGGRTAHAQSAAAGAPHAAGGTARRALPRRGDQCRGGSFPECPWSWRESRSAVDVRVSPAQEIAPDLHARRVFAPQPRASGREAHGPVDSEPAVRHLERELEQMKSPPARYGGAVRSQHGGDESEQ